MSAELLIEDQESLRAMRARLPLSLEPPRAIAPDDDPTHDEEHQFVMRDLGLRLYVSQVFNDDGTGAVLVTGWRWPCPFVVGQLPAYGAADYAILQADVAMAADLLAGRRDLPAYARRHRNAVTLQYPVV